MKPMRGEELMKVPGGTSITDTPDEAALAFMLVQHSVHNIWVADAGH